MTKKKKSKMTKVRTVYTNSASSIPYGSKIKINTK